MTKGRNQTQKETHPHSNGDIRFIWNIIQYSFNTESNFVEVFGQEVGHQG